MPKNIFDDFNDDDNRGNSYGTEVVPVALGDTESFLNEAIVRQTRRCQALQKLIGSKFLASCKTHLTVWRPR
jgi:hypothetical protein